MSLGVVSNMVSMTRRLLARREDPVSVSSAMASTRPGTRTLASVDPQEYSTSAVMPRPLRWLRVAVTSSVAMRLPCRS